VRQREEVAKGLVDLFRKPGMKRPLMRITSTITPQPSPPAVSTLQDRCADSTGNASSITRVPCWPPPSEEGPASRSLRTLWDRPLTAREVVFLSGGTDVLSNAGLFENR